MKINFEGNGCSNEHNAKQKFVKYQDDLERNNIKHFVISEKGRFYPVALIQDRIDFRMVELLNHGISIII